MQVLAGYSIMNVQYCLNNSYSPTYTWPRIFMECRWAILAAATGPKPSFTPTTQRHVYTGIDSDEPSTAVTSREQEHSNRTPAKKLIRTALGTMFIRTTAPLQSSMSRLRARGAQCTLRERRANRGAPGEWWVE